MANVPAIPPSVSRGADRPPPPAERPRPSGAAAFHSHLKRARGHLPGTDKPLSMAGPPGRLSGAHRAPEAEVGPEVDSRGRRLELEGEPPDDKRPSAALDVDPLDPMARALFSDGCHRLGFERAAEIATPSSPSAPSHDAVMAAARVSLEQVMSRFVRRVAWSGDAQTGSARLELGAGALAGATLTIHADRGAVRVAIELPPGVDRAQWRDRIAQRLDARGLQVTALEVD